MFYYKLLPDIKDGVLYNKGKYFILCKDNVHLSIVGVVLYKTKNF